MGWHTSLQGSSSSSFLSSLTSNANLFPCSPSLVSQPGCSVSVPLPSSSPQPPGSGPQRPQGPPSHPAPWVPPQTTRRKGTLLLSCPSPSSAERRKRKCQLLRLQKTVQTKCRANDRQRRRGHGVRRCWGPAASGRVGQKEPQGPAPASESQHQKQLPLSGFPGKVGMVIGDFHRILETLLVTFEEISIKERQWPCCNYEN